MSNRQSIFENVHFLNEAFILKFIEDNKTLEVFKKEALKITQTMEEIVSETATAGAFGSFMGIKFNKATEKIDNDEPKKYYTIGFTYNEMLKAAGEKFGFKDFFFLYYSKVLKPIEECAKKCGYTEVKSSNKNFHSFIKKYKPGIMFNFDYALSSDNMCNIYIRCLEDTEENRAILVGGKKYLED